MDSPAALPLESIPAPQGRTVSAVYFSDVRFASLWLIASSDL